MIGNPHYCAVPTCDHGVPPVAITRDDVARYMATLPDRSPVARTFSVHLAAGQRAWRGIGYDDLVGPGVVRYIAYRDGGFDGRFTPTVPVDVIVHR